MSKAAESSERRRATAVATRPARNRSDLGCIEVPTGALRMYRRLGSCGLQPTSEPAAGRDEADGFASSLIVRRRAVPTATARQPEFRSRCSESNRQPLIWVDDA